MNNRKELIDRIEQLQQLSDNYTAQILKVEQALLEEISTFKKGDFVRVIDREGEEKGYAFIYQVQLAKDEHIGYYPKYTYRKCTKQGKIGMIKPFIQHAGDIIQHASLEEHLAEINRL